MKDNLISPQDMGINTSAAFAGKVKLEAVRKTYSDIVNVVAGLIRTLYSKDKCKEKKLVDVGSYAGEFLNNVLSNLAVNNYSFYSVTGIDINEETLSKNSIVDEKIVCDVIHIPVLDDAFDIALVRYLLQWNSLERQEKIITELVRTTKDYVIISHPTVDREGQKKFHELFCGNIIPQMKRAESYYSTKEQLENFFMKHDISYYIADSERIENISDVFITRYAMSGEETRKLKEFLGENDWWDRITWVISKKNLL